MQKGGSLSQLDGIAGNTELINAAVASKRHKEEIQSGRLRQDSKQMQALSKKFGALCERLTQAAQEEGANRHPAPCPLCSCMAHLA